MHAVSMFLRSSNESLDKSAARLFPKLLNCADTQLLYATGPLERSSGLTDFLYQRDREIIAFGRPDLAVPGAY